MIGGSYSNITSTPKFMRCFIGPINKKIANSLNPLITILKKAITYSNNLEW
jgi:hypothetical protein